MNDTEESLLADPYFWLGGFLSLVAWSAIWWAIANVLESLY